jgi:response regulator of citrate/malate metabolism
MKPFSYDDLRVRLEHYQQAYAGMAGEQADQADIDRVFGVSGTDRRLPKGFSPQTLRLVEDSLRGPGTGDLSAAEAASALGISRVSARRYLEHLVETGKAQVSLRYGEVGRPERRYSWR